MAYVRKKRNKSGSEYYQLVESRRVDGKPRQRILAYLGQYPSVEVALQRIPVLIDLVQRGHTFESARDVLEYRHEGHWMWKQGARKPEGFLEEKLRRLRTLRESGAA